MSGLLILITSLLIANTSASNFGAVDLHAHLFMKEGTTWLFRGDFNSPLRASKVGQLWSSKVNADALNQSNLSVVVVSLYAHPLATMSLRASILRQIEQAEKFVAENPTWVIARTANQAGEALSFGKRVLVLSLETASGILENEADLKTFIDDHGIRIVTFIHLTGDHYGGVAFLKGFHILSSPLDWLRSLFSPHHDEQGTLVNAVGLSDDGRKMVEALIKRKVWIDLAHSSDETQRDLIPMLEKAGQPLLYTHTAIRELFRAERSISNSQLAEVAKTHGMIGLIPSEDMLEVPEVKSCDTAMQTYADEFKFASKVLGSDSVTIGTDINAPLRGIRACGGDYVTYEQIPKLWNDLVKLGAPIPDPAGKLTEHFLAAWSHVN